MWEIPVAGGASWLVLALMIFPAGQGVAGWLFAGGFVWPRGSTSLVRSVAGLMAGHPGQGLAGKDVAHVASTPSIYVLIVIGELLLIAVTGWLVMVWWRCLGPGALRGMADRAEVERVLGVSNLRTKRSVIRPDLTARRPRIRKEDRA